MLRAEATLGCPRHTHGCGPFANKTGEDADSTSYHSAPPRTRPGGAPPPLATGLKASLAGFQRHRLFGQRWPWRGCERPFLATADSGSRAPGRISGTESHGTKWEIAQLRRRCLNQIADHYRPLLGV